MKATKQKQFNAPMLTAMAGKTIVFSGKFEYDEKERLSRKALALQAKVAEEIDASTTYVVSAGGHSQTVQKKAAALNKKGATVQLIGDAAFDTMATPDEAAVLELMRGGHANAQLFNTLIASSTYYKHGVPPPATMMISEQKFDQLDLSHFKFERHRFQRCSFVGATLDETELSETVDCDFSKATGSNTNFANSDKNRFKQARFAKPRFDWPVAGNDFSGAIFDEPCLHDGPQGERTDATHFSKSTMRNGKLEKLTYDIANFDGADLTGSALLACDFKASSFQGASLTGCSFIDCELPGADFTRADLTNANLSGTDLTGASFDGANLANCNLRGAKVDKAGLSKAKNFDPATTQTGTAGAALSELEQIASAARKVELSFFVRTDDKTDGDKVSINSQILQYDYGITFPDSMPFRQFNTGKTATFSDAMIRLSQILGGRKVRFETIEVDSKKSTKSGKELRSLVMDAIAEVFAQPVPSPAELAAAGKALRAEKAEAIAINRERLKKAKELAEKQQFSAKRLIAKKIEKEVGKVTDIATFLKALELRADKSKIDKATKMLKAEKFQLFNDITETHMNGVVKSQTDPDLVYACRIESGGQYACCTQNLNICGGLRGSICKHLLVLIIGLVKAGQLDPGDIDTWIAKTHDTKPELNKETMGEIFIRYKGAEAGEVDWRPTETVPEDYYAV